jgi:uncharacterized surface protein with fasciclin (FAS1) repeats
MQTISLRAVATVMALLTLPAVVSCSDSTSEPPAAPGNIVQTLTEAGNFTTLVAAIEAAGLSGTLQGPGPFTVFAPTDAAFAKLPAGTLEALLGDPEQLASILTYHVVAGSVTAGDIVASNGATPTTVNGQPLDIVVQDGTVYVNGAQVVAADIAASNGVIHAIDTVLLPKAADASSGR